MGRYYQQHICLATPARATCCAASAAGNVPSRGKREWGREENALFLSELMDFLVVLFFILSLKLKVRYDK